MIAEVSSEEGARAHTLKEKRRRDGFHKRKRADEGIARFGWVDKYRLNVMYSVELYVARRNGCCRCRHRRRHRRHRNPIRTYTRQRRCNADYLTGSLTIRQLGKTPRGVFDGRNATPTWRRGVVRVANDKETGFHPPCDLAHLHRDTSTERRAFTLPLSLPPSFSRSLAFSFSRLPMTPSSSVSVHIPRRREAAREPRRGKLFYFARFGISPRGLIHIHARTRALRLRNVPVVVPVSLRFKHGLLIVGLTLSLIPLSPLISSLNEDKYYLQYARGLPARARFRN